MGKIHIHWHRFRLTIAQVGDLQYFDLYRCRCGREKIKSGYGLSPNFWTPTDPITGEPLL